MRNCLCHGPAMALVGEGGDGVVGGEPENFRAGFGRFCGSVGIKRTEKEGAVFFEIAFAGAVNEFDAVAEAAMDDDFAPGFFEQFAMKGLLGIFARVRAAAGEADAAGGLDDGEFVSI